MISKKEAAEFDAGSSQYRDEQARREQVAQDGDIDALWEILTRPRPVGFDPSEIFPHLVKAIEVRARQSPQAFAGEILTRVVSLTSYLCMRDQFLIIRSIEQFARSAQGRGRIDLPPPLADRAIPRLLDLQRSLCEVLGAQATILRMHELAKAKRIENDRAERKPSAKATGKTKAKASRKPPSAPVHINGKHDGNAKLGANRIADLLDELVGGPHGDPEDD